MKQIFVFLFTALFFQLSAQDLFKGKIVDDSSSENLSYVNIGVIGKSIGTVSDLDGNFEIKINDKNDADTIRFSMIGYEPLEMIVADFKKELKSNKTIQLKQSVTELKQATVTGKDLIEKVLGNETQSENVTGTFGTDVLGNEIGVVMKVKKKRMTYIKDFNFSIAKNEYGKLKFRLNIYEMKKGMPDKNILPENIFVETEIEQGLVRVDLTKFNLWVEKDFLVALEWIEDLGEGGLHFSARFLGAPMMARDASQGDWEKISVASLGFNCTVRY